MNKIGYEEVVAAGKAGTETLMAVVNTAFAGVERLAALNLNTARSVLESGAKNAKSVLAVKEPKELLGLQASLAQPTLEGAISYGRSVYEIIGDTSGELVKLFDAQLADLNKSVTTAIDKAAKSAPAGTEAAFGAVKQALAAANSAYTGMTKAAKQVTELTEANVAAATAATVKAVGTAATKAKKAA